MSNSFVHLRIHTEFSLIDSIVRVKPLVKKVAELGMPACAISDIGNFFGLIKFYKAAQAVGVKPIVACDFWLPTDLDESGRSLITLLAMDLVGYKNIIQVISKGYLLGQTVGGILIQMDWIKEHSDGVIALSGGRFGEVGQAILAGKSDLAAEKMQFMQSVFPDRFYLEITRTQRLGEEDYIHQVVPLADQLGIPLVVTNDVRFLAQSQFEIHEARVCITEGRTLTDPRRERIFTDAQYLKTPEEMVELFCDLPDAVENSVEIAKRCNLSIQLGKYFLPEYPIPEGMTENEFFAEISKQGLDKRLSKLFDVTASDFEKKREPYDDRINFELDIITQMGFAGYFLIVMDFIGWAKRHDIPVGPGRGSGAGSLVAYALDITDLDPLQYDLLFERFLNPERVSMPDFDIDFCMDNRDAVIGYVADNYGRDAVSQIITFGTMAAKAVVRDVARVQGKSYGLADKLSKMIPGDPGMTLKVAFDQEAILRDFLAGDSDGQEIWEMALQLEGLTRNVGKHAGGVVIAPTKLTDFAPLYCDEAGSGLVTQYDKGDVEEAGLVKFDFLGLRTLTIIDWAKKMIDKRRMLQGLAPLDISLLPLDDQATYNLLKKAETTAVFQLESRGMKDLIKRLQPDNIEDLIALVALFRPGPLQSGMVDDFINRKHGRAKVAYPDAKYQHESLKPILEPTYGVIVYQEQVMQIAQVLAGYTLGGADLLRRAMGKKKPEEMAKQREVFQDGAKSKGIDPELAIRIFDLVEKFAGYGFNKSHSAAYALVSYQTAWLKAHYPSQFMAATISSDMDKTDKVVTFIEEVRAMGIALLPPDVNRGEFHFTVDEQDNIIYGLGAIKGLGEAPVDNIIAARQSGPFLNLFDFCTRIDVRRVNKRALEALVRSGAFDSIGPKIDVDYDRSIMWAALSEAVKTAEQHHANTHAGMTDLFGQIDSAPAGNTDVYADFSHLKRWNIKERLNGERDTLGLYLTGHPIDEYERELSHIVSSRLSHIKVEKSKQTVAGLVVAFRVMKTKKGDTMGFVTLDDRTGRLEVAVFSDVYTANREKLVKDALLVIEGQVSNDDFSGGLKMRADSVLMLADAREAKVSALRVRLAPTTVSYHLGEELKQCLQRHKPGQCNVVIEYQLPRVQGDVGLGAAWRVRPSDELLAELRALYGLEAVSLIYGAKSDSLSAVH